MLRCQMHNLRWPSPPVQIAPQCCRHRYANTDKSSSRAKDRGSTNSEDCQKVFPWVTTGDDRGPSQTSTSRCRQPWTNHTCAYEGSALCLELSRSGEGERLTCSSWRRSVAQGFEHR
eukprot:6570830-Prymnesium_polylepis.1